MASTSFIAWSHSRRKDFLECPKAFYHKNVAPKGSPDKIEFTQTQAMKDGNAVDDALTARISKGTPLPPQYAPYEAMAAAVLAAPGQKFTQMQLALDQVYKPCGYRDWDTAWCRAIFDVAVLNKDHAFIGDWKNGQIWLDSDQLKLFAAVAFHTFPEIDSVDTSYIWLKPGITSDEHYTRRELGDIWAALMPPVERMQVCFKTNHWPATPARGEKSCARCSVNQAGKCKEAQGPYKG